MASSLKDTSLSDSKLHITPARQSGAGTRLVVGVTSDQTCLVLAGRLRALRHAGFDVTLVSSPGELLEFTAAAEGVRPRAIAMARGIAPLRDLFSLWGLLVFLWRHRPAITDFSTPKAGLLGNLAAWALRVPHRVYTLRGLKLESAAGWKWRLLLWAERLSARCAHVVLCNSPSLLETAQRLKIAPQSKLKMIGDGSSNGVDLTRYSPGTSRVRADLAIAETDLVVGFVGRLTTDKGIPELLVAFQNVLDQFSQSWLLLVGWFDEAEDALGENVQRYIRQHPRICHVGFVTDTAPYYRAMDVMVLPTHREGFPNAVLEASASGVPVVTADTTGATEAVVDGVTGQLIPPDSANEITASLVKLLGDKDMRNRMGQEGRKWAVQQFSQERVLSLAVEFYKGLKNREQGTGNRD